jgi:hypothetical protein
MLRWISIFGGLLIMMGHHACSEALFYYFRLEDQVPENHLLRLIDKHISFEFVRERLRTSYSDSGRPSIDPELLLRILLIGYLYGISSERKLVEELRMHLAWRWFAGLGFDQEIPHHSTFSKNRHGRNRSCSRSCLNRSCASVWKWDWCKASTCRSMAASSKPTRPRRADKEVNIGEDVTVRYFVHKSTLSQTPSASASTQTTLPSPASQ